MSAKDIECPRCGAEADTACRNPSGWHVEDHSERKKAAASKTKAPQNKTFEENFQKALAAAPVNRASEGGWYENRYTPRGRYGMAGMLRYSARQTAQKADIFIDVDNLLLSMDPISAAEEVNKVLRSKKSPISAIPGKKSLKWSVNQGTHAKPYYVSRTRGDVRAELADLGIVV